jgi:hypothetical protein
MCMRLNLSGAAVLCVGLVPRRPENERKRAVSPDNIQIHHAKILLTPEARRRDDGLAFPDHRLEVFDHLQRGVLFLIAKINER